MMQRLNIFLVLILLTLILSGCTGKTDEDSTLDTTLEVFAGIPPTAYLVEEIGGNHVSVNTLVQAGQSPHSFEPSPRQISELGKAKLFFTTGMPFEEQLEGKLSSVYTDMTIVPTDRNVPKRMMNTSHHHHHGHDSHAETAVMSQPDPHIWLSPTEMIHQAVNIAEALILADSIHVDDYRDNLARFKEHVSQVDGEIRKILTPFRGKSFFVFHPSFGYFGDHYGLRQKAIEIEGKSPTIKQISELKRQAIEEKVQVIFIQPQFDRERAEIIANAIDGEVVVLDPLEFNVLDNMLVIADKIRSALTHEL